MFVFWCMAIDMWLFLTMPWVCLQFVIVVFPDHTQLLFMGRNAIFFGGFLLLVYKNCIGINGLPSLGYDKLEVEQ